MTDQVEAEESNPDHFWRILRDRDGGTPVIVEMMAWDEWDYDKTRFLSDRLFTREAAEALLQELETEQTPQVRVFCPRCDQPVRPSADRCGGCGQALTPIVLDVAFLAVLRRTRITTPAWPLVGLDGKYPV